MPFIHPLLFWLGLGGISIPILIHILNRRRFKIVDWAAMKFLLDALRKNRKRLQIEELILLALRCLIIALIGFALARFLGCQTLEQVGLGNGGRTIVFVLDDSVSMGQKYGQKTVFDLAKDDLAEQLGKLQPGDQVAIFLTSQPDQQKAFVQLGELDDSESVLGRLKTLKPSDQRTRLSAALETAERILAKDPSEKRRVYLFGDFRQNDLADAAEAAKLRSLYSALQNNKVNVVTMDYGKTARSNLTLESLVLKEPYSVLGNTTRVALTVKNNGTVTAENVNIDLSVTYYDAEKEKLVTQSLPMLTVDSVDPDQIWKKEFAFTPSVVGTNVITASLGGDELPGDNQARLSVDVRKNIRILMVDGSPSALQKQDAESYSLKHALEPYKNVGHGFRVETITREDIPNTTFTDYDVVYLLNVQNFPREVVAGKTPTAADAVTAAKAIASGVDSKKSLKDNLKNAIGSPDALGKTLGKATDALAGTSKSRLGGVEQYASVARLEQFVSQGGGLVIFTGDKIDLEFYNGRLFNHGAGLSPLEIEQVQNDGSDPTRRGKHWRMDPKSVTADGAMRFFSGDLMNLTKGMWFFAFTPAKVGTLMARDQAGKPTIDARFDDKQRHPAVVSRRFGKGRSVMIYSTASMRWNNWPMDSSELGDGMYIIPMADLATRLARPQAPVFTQTVGRAIRRTLQPEWRDATATLYPPNASAELVTLEPDDKNADRPTVQYDKPTMAGTYRMVLKRPGGKQIEWQYVRNVDVAEGVLMAGGQERLTATFGGSEFAYFNRIDPEQSGDLRHAEEKNHWVWAIVALLALLAVETYLAHRFGHWT